MVADWMGAGRAITGRWDVASWYEANAHKMVLHPDVRVQVENLIARSTTRRPALGTRCRVRWKASNSPFGKLVGQCCRHRGQAQSLSRSG
jgi:hypothetical protein